MNDDVEAILRRVAAGELTPEDALPLLDATRGPAAPEWGTPPTTDAPPGSGGENAPPRTIRIAVSYRSVDVIADPDIDQVSVTGDHTIRREGDVLVVESLQLPGFTEFESRSRESGGTWSFIGLPRSTAWARSMRGGHVTVRVNPTLPIDVDSAAAALRISGCEGGAHLRLVAASLKVDRLRGQLDLEALTSAVKGTAAITGTSRISCESSSVRLALLPGSDFRATTSSNCLGKVVLPGTPKTGPSGQPESVVGNGEGRLVIDGVMSSITISSDQAKFQASA